MISTIEAGPRSSPFLNDAVGDFVSIEIWNRPGMVRDYCSLAVMDDDRLIAGVLYHNHYPDAGVIELTAASVDKRWLTRPVLKSMFAMAFERFKCQLCVLRVSEYNKPMLRMAKAYGFTEYVIPRLRGRDEAEHVLTLTDDVWRQSRFHKEH